jgi:hypothetical protein
LPDEIAADWIVQGWGIKLLDDPPEPPKIETAAFEGAPETAVGRRQRRQ